jgi:hypothetical protein
MPPGNELSREVLRDRVPLDEAGEQALTERFITASASQFSRA